MEHKEMNFCEAVKHYRKKLEKHMQEYMDMDVSDRSGTSVEGMAARWKKIKEMEKELQHQKLMPKDLHHWAKNLRNNDGSTGPRWTIEQTTPAAKTAGVLFGAITPEEFWLTMNMMYSDYGGIAEKYGANKPEMYADMAKAFLFDKDGPDPEEKLAAYYRAIVCGD